MMEGLGKESSFCSSRPFQWFDHADNEAPSGWKLTDCFSSFEHTAPLSEKPVGGSLFSFF
uniref:Uncharacterized protein n=1 Tax=Anguilla anguilla TaxID=7936 RepID=A0A0E9W825_ANGAN